MKKVAARRLYAFAKCSLPGILIFLQQTFQFHRHSWLILYYKFIQKLHSCDIGQMAGKSIYSKIDEHINTSWTRLLMHFTKFYC